MEQLGKLALLLDVVHKAATAGPAYAWIVNMADAEIAKLKPKPEVEAAVVPTTKFPALAPNDNGGAPKPAA